MENKYLKECQIAVSITFLEDFFKAVKENINLIEKMTMQKMQCHFDLNVYDFVIEFKESVKFMFLRKVFSYCHIESVKK